MQSETFIRDFYTQAYASLEAPHAGKFTVVAGSHLDIPIILNNIHESEAKLVVTTSDSSQPPGVVCTLENQSLHIVGTKPGLYRLKLFIVDKFLPYLTGDPEADSPLDIEIEVV